MKYLKNFLLALSIIILCSGCLFTHSKKHSVLGTWKLKRVEQKSSQFDKSNLLNLSLSKGDLLSIFKDSTLSMVNTENQQIASWSIDDDYALLTLKLKNDLAKNYEVNFSTTRNGTEILKLKDESDGSVSIFSREAVPLKDIDHEPFHPSNLQWRIKASTSESAQLLQRRLENYIKHVSLILYKAKQQKPDMVSFELSQGPIRIYSNGIGVFPFAVVKPVWKNTYFNEKEAAAAHKIFEDYLRNNKYTGVSTGKWVDDDYNMLLSVFKGLRNSTQEKPVR